MNILGFFTKKYHWYDWYGARSDNNFGLMRKIYKRKNSFPLNVHGETLQHVIDTSLVDQVSGNRNNFEKFKLYVTEFNADPLAIDSHHISFVSFMLGFNNIETRYLDLIKDVFKTRISEIIESLEITRLHYATKKLTVSDGFAQWIQQNNFNEFISAFCIKFDDDTMLPTTARDVFLF